MPLSLTVLNRFHSRRAKVCSNSWNIYATGRERAFHMSTVISKFVELKSGFEVQIEDEEGHDLSSETYDESTNTYIIPDIPTPHIMRLDGA